MKKFTFIFFFFSFFNFLVLKAEMVKDTLFLPENVGMCAKSLARIDSIVLDGIQKKAFPGCQVLILKDSLTIYDKCFGKYTYEGDQTVQPTTLYDLASLSKTTGTLLAIMKLYDTGKLKLSDKASSFLTFLKGTDKENITIFDLLVHETGLPAGLPFYEMAIEKIHTPPFMYSPDTVRTIRLNSKTSQYKPDWVSKWQSAEFQSQVSDSFFIHNRFHQAAMQKIAATRLGKKTYLYSCLNFILLKEIAETITGIPMDVFLDNEFFAPMNLHNITYLPLRTHRKDEIAPTLKNDFLRNGLIQGFVHDPDAAFLGGVSGNAGLFASAHDVAMINLMLLNNGKLNEKQYLSPETCRMFTTTTSASGRRGLGFDKPTPSNPENNPCGKSAAMEVFGHTGYTGTCCWVDPVNRIIFVFLSNRTYPNDGENILARMKIRPKIDEVIYQSIIQNKK